MSEYKQIPKELSEENKILRKLLLGIKIYISMQKLLSKLQIT